jgi:hypothetical protein
MSRDTAFDQKVPRELGKRGKPLRCGGRGSETTQGLKMLVYMSDASSDATRLLLYDPHCHMFEKPAKYLAAHVRQPFAQPILKPMSPQGPGKTRPPLLPTTNATTTSCAEPSYPPICKTLLLYRQIVAGSTTFFRESRRTPTTRRAFLHPESAND